MGAISKVLLGGTAAEILKANRNIADKEIYADEKEIKKRGVTVPNTANANVDQN